MKLILNTVLVIFIFLLVGCSSESETHQEKLARATAMLSQGYEMTGEQKQKVDALMKQANELIASGKNEEASKVLSEAITELERIAEWDRFNKSE